MGVESPSFFLVVESGTVGVSYNNYFDIKKVDHEKVSISFWGEKGEGNSWTKIMLILNLGEIKQVIIISSSKRTIWNWSKNPPIKKGKNEGETFWSGGY